MGQSLACTSCGPSLVRSGGGGGRVSHADVALAGGRSGYKLHTFQSLELDSKRLRCTGRVHERVTEQIRLGECECE